MQKFRAKYFVLPVAIICASGFLAVPAFSQSHTHNLSLWQQYCKEGEKANRHGDPALAKRYFLGALTELEKTKPAKGSRLTSYVSRLEKRILDLYPDDWTVDENNPSAQLALQEEQVAVFSRVNTIAADFAAPNQLTQKVVATRYRKAYSDLQKTRTAVAARKADKKISAK